MSGPYDDIIELPHHVSDKHPRMPALDRAAQFAPFAALTGFGAAITETGRLTAQRIELDEYEKAALNEKLIRMAAQIAKRPMVTLTYFKPDVKKAGGAYVSVTDTVRKLDKYERLVVMENAAKIPIDDIVGIELE